MKKLLSGVMLALLLLGAGDASAQNYQVPAHSIPIGRGPGVGSFNSAGPGTAGQLFIGQGASADPQWKSASGACTVTSAGVFTCSGSGGGLTVGTTTIGSGSNTAIEFNNAGILGEYAISGSGNVCMTNSCSMVTPALGTPSALVLTNATGLPVAGINGLGTGVGSALGVNVGSAGAFVTLNGALGTPSSGTATNLTGTAAGLTAGHVTTNANLTGPITSTGNATSIASQTGTGTTFVMSGSPSIASPTVTGAFTATGLVTNADLVNAATTVNGATCTLGSTCSPTAAPSGTAGGDLSGTYPNPNVAKINGTALSGLATGILKNTTVTGVPSIAINSDLPAMTATVGGAVPTPPNNTTTFLRGDGTFATPPGGGSVANPTGTIGLTAVNGSATSAIRSDGAPALSQAIVPTWTGAHTFTGGINSTGLPLTYVPNNSPVTTNGAANFQATTASTNQNILLNAEIKSNSLSNQGSVAGQFSNEAQAGAASVWAAVGGVQLDPSWALGSYSAFATELDINNLAGHFGDTLSTGNSASILMNGIGYRNTTALLVSTATTGVLTATVNAGGSGYAINDTITLNATPGTTGEAAIAKVLTLSGSAVATVSITTPGWYLGTPTTATQLSTSGAGIGATFNLTSGTVPVWNNGIYFNATAIKTDAVHDASGAVNSYHDVGSHTTGVNLAGSYSSWAIAVGSGGSPNYSVDASGNEFIQGVITRGSTTPVAGQIFNLGGGIANAGGNTVGVLVNATHTPAGGSAAVSFQNNVRVSVTSPNVDTVYGYYGSAATKTGTGTLGTVYGAFFENNTLGTTANWSIWSAGDVHFDKSIFSGAGTTTVAPIVLAAGTNLTTAAAGAMEFDGKAFYATSAASSRQVVDTEQLTILSADNTAPTNVATAQNVFPTGQGTLTVQGSTAYEFEAEYEIDSTGTTSNALQTLFGGTATFTGITYNVISTNSASSSVPAAASMRTATVTTAISATAAVAAATQRQVRLRGTMRINAGGTVIPEFQFSAAPGAAPVVRTNSFFRMWPAGSNTVTQVGNWS